MPTPPPPGLELPNNPGTIEELHKKCQGVFPMFFEGAKLLVNKGLNSHFQVSHTLTLDNSERTGYRFGATYVGTQMLSPTEVVLKVLGLYDSISRKFPVSGISTVNGRYRPKWKHECKYHPRSN